MRNIKSAGKIVCACGLVAAMTMGFALTGCGSDKAVSVSDSGSSSSSSSSASNSSKGSGNNSSAKEADAETDYMNLSVGKKVTFEDGLEVSVDETKNVKDFSGDTLIAVKVTYYNGGSGQASYNYYDWQSEDKDGAQEYSTFYTGSEKLDTLSSGELKAGGKKSGWLFFPKNTKKAVYSSSILSDASASWKL